MTLIVYPTVRDNVRGVFFEVYHPQLSKLLPFLPDFFPRPSKTDSIRYSNFIPDASIPVSYDGVSPTMQVWYAFCLAQVDQAQTDSAVY